MHERTRSAAALSINPQLDAEQLAATYREHRRLHIPHFLCTGDAVDLYRTLVSEVRWRTFLVANERRLGTPPDIDDALTLQEEREIADCACNGARSGFASLFDANGLLSENPGDSHAETPLLVRFTSFLNSPAVLALMRGITGISELSRADAHAVRFRPGHFITFHDATPGADETGTRRASYALDLTPEWRPEWGGMIEFRTQNGYAIEAFMPCFNVMTLFAFPQGHWVSVVAPFANGPRYSMMGSMYAA